MVTEYNNTKGGMRKWLPNIIIQKEVEEINQQLTIHETDLTRVLYIYIYIGLA